MALIRTALSPLRGHSSRARIARMALVSVVLLALLLLLGAQTTGVVHTIVRGLTLAVGFNFGATISTEHTRRREASC